MLLISKINRRSMISDIVNLTYLSNYTVDMFPADQNWFICGIILRSTTFYCIMNLSHQQDSSFGEVTVLLNLLNFD